MHAKDLLPEIDKALIVTKKWDTMKASFSDDEGEAKLAELNGILGTIRTLVEMNELKEVLFPKNEILKDSIGHKRGALVAIRPVAQEYGNKTYLGFYIGDMPLSSVIGISKEAIQLSWSQYNPAIFVPELGKVIYGCESWWGEIKDENDFKKITDETISDQWYVKMYRKLNEKPETKSEKGLVYLRHTSETFKSPVLTVGKIYKGTVDDDTFTTVDDKGHEGVKYHRCSALFSPATREEFEEQEIKTTEDAQKN